MKDPSCQEAITFINTNVNSDIEKMNVNKGWNSDCGKIPLKYLLDKYQATHDFRTRHKNTTDLETKKDLATMFEAVCTATQEFCTENGFPATWAWPNTDITQDPAWLSEVDELQPSSSAGTGNGAINESGTGAGTGAGSGSGSGSGYHDDAEMKDAEALPGGAGFANNDDTEISEDMENLTLAGEPIISIQKMFKSYQLLVQEKSGLHV